MLVKLEPEYVILHKFHLQLNWLTQKTPCLVQESWWYLIYKPSYSRFCDQM